MSDGHRKSGLAHSGEAGHLNESVAVHEILQGCVCALPTNERDGRRQIVPDPWSGGREQIRCLRQDLVLELRKFRSGVDTEILEQCPARFPLHRQRIDLPASAVERRHEE